MPYRFAWALDQTGPLARSAFHHLLDCLTTINANYLRAHPEAPTLAASKVQYLPEAQGQDDWLDIPSTLYLGTGDSEDLVTWRAAEIRARENVQARAVVLPNGRLVVQRPNGQIEDVLPPNAPPVVIGDLLRRVIFRLDLFNGPWEMDLSRKALDAMLLALFRIDVDYLRANPGTPGIYQSGLDYREEPMGQEEWQDIPTALKMGIADCEDLASWRAAEILVREGRDAKPFFSESKRPNGGVLFHIRTVDAQGRVEDPSYHLGMR